MDISTRDFLYSAQCGFEFEFFSNLNRNEIVDSLGKTLGKKILLFSFKNNSAYFVLKI